MYRVLIVEDEMLVRMGLKNAIEWSKFDMTVVADASDGKTALDIYESEKPDIIITDLKMPIMSGMELIENIRKKDHSTRIIILTCLEEFELAKKAVAMGVSGYISKLTMTTEEIEEFLKKLQNELKLVNASNESFPDINHDNIKENLMKNYIFYKLNKADEFASKIKSMNLRMNPERLIMCLMEIKNYENLKEKFMDKRGSFTKNAILNIFNELLEGYGRGEVFQDTEKRYVFIFSFHDISSENKISEMLHEIISRIWKLLNTFFNIGVFFGISTLQNGYENLRSMYNECEKTCELVYFLHDEKSLRWSENMETQYLTASVECLLTLPEKLYNEGIINEIQKGRFELKLSELLDKGCTQKDQITRILFQLIEWFSCEFNIQGDEKSGLIVEYMEKIKACEAFHDALRAFHDYIFNLNELSSRKQCYSKGIGEVIRFIDRNYKNDLPLKELAEKAGLTPNYLSSLFKKEAGLYLADYINKVRVEKAKELLLRTNMKSCEIAEMVGFTDDSYFSRIFKKFTRVRPNEFRRYYISGNSGGKTDENH